MAMRTKEEIMAHPSNPHNTNQVEVLIDIRDVLVDIAATVGQAVYGVNAAPAEPIDETAGQVEHEDVPQDAQTAPATEGVDA